MKTDRGRGRYEMGDECKNNNNNRFEKLIRKKSVEASWKWIGAGAGTKWKTNVIIMTITDSGSLLGNDTKKSVRESWKWIGAGAGTKWKTNVIIITITEQRSLPRSVHTCAFLNQQHYYKINPSGRCYT